MRPKIILLTLHLFSSAFSARSLSMPTKDSPSRRAVINKVAAASLAVVTGSGVNMRAAFAVPEILMTQGGIKYAILKPSKEKGVPLKGDIVAIEYTGYLIDGTIFDASHAEGKKNALMFEVGGNAVVDGINEMVMNMGVGEKVQAIIPADKAFGDKGLCLENGECLIKPKSTLVYDVFLKRSAIPPP